jgi:hypothetical protein
MMQESETVCPSCGQSQENPGRTEGSNSFDDPSLSWGERVVGTIREVMTAPNTFFSTLKESGEIKGPFIYYMVLSLISIIAYLFWQTLLSSSMSSLIPSMGPLGGAEHNPFTPAMLPFLLFFSLLMGAVSPFITAGLYHLVLLLFGEGKRGYVTTLRVIFFSQTAGILYVIPFIGSLLAGVWSLALQAMGLSQRHHISVGKALLVIFGTFFFLIVLVFLFVVFFVVAAGVSVR